MKIIKLTILLGLFIQGTAFAQNPFPPSQRELNGYLLHQFDDAVSESFQGLAQEIKHEDGWGDRAYWLTKEHHTYMVFGYPKSTSECSSGCSAIQLTGKDDPTVLPFLGLRLGASKESVISHIGKPTSIRHSDSLNLDLYTYDNRNYTVEIDSNNCLHSIRINGEGGFVNNPSIDTSNTLQRIRKILLSQRADTILELLAGNMEISIPQSNVYCILKGSVRKVIQDPQSPLSKLLYSSKVCVATLLTNIAIKRAEMNLRITEDKGLGIVYKLTTTAGLMDIVLFQDTGKYRIYEIKLGY
jgi:hypothetical protein